MPPRKKLSASKKQSTQSHGIQHFFDRHTQNSQSLKSKQAGPGSGSKQPGPVSAAVGAENVVEKGVKDSKLSLGPVGARKNESVSRRSGVVNLEFGSGRASDSVEKSDDSGLLVVGSEGRKTEPGASRSCPITLYSEDTDNDGEKNVDSEFGDRKSEVGSKGIEKKMLSIRAWDSVGNGKSVQRTPNENLMQVVGEAGNLDEVSPEVSRLGRAKRFKFSPGMLIKQSQDDGADEITWKISPVNERLQALSKNMPDVVKMLADSSRVNALYIQRCSMNKTSPNTKDEMGKRFPSPLQKTCATHLISSNVVGSKMANLDQHYDPYVNTDNENNAIASRESPFQTPPSLPYHDKLVDDFCNNIPDQYLRQNKKALLELLDQVEDVISAEEAVPKGQAIPSRNNDEMPAACSPVIQNVSINQDQPINTDRVLSDPCFLVLEVSEKCGSFGSHCPQRPYKVLRLLNELTGEERAVHLWEEWFYSVIAPGDIVKVIGEFDDEGKCNMTRDKNFLIVHPDILLSGTRVASSFTCPRRAVLDERLKSSEQSTAALVGTLLHQIFQAGLVKNTPTKDFLEEYGRTVLKKNIENMYACGVSESEMHRVLTEAIPKLLNWIRLFKDPQDSGAPSVDFGRDEGLKKVHISEVIDIEEMAWAPKYGLKGMIDASLRVKLGSNNNGLQEKIFPLEFKTGKGSSGQTSMEHCAQVILYTLLMSERYMKHIDSGLLYYLQTDQTQGIAVRRSDVVGLVMRRNELASDILKASIRQQLPPMLQSPSMCKGCRHLNVCTAYHKAHGGDTKSSGLGDLFDSHIHHLTTADCIFLRHWDRLIDLEAKELELRKRELWSPCTTRSERSASCIRSVVLETSDKFPHEKSSNGRFIYCFVRKGFCHADDGTQFNEPTSTINSKSDSDSTLRNGDYVLLSIESSGLAIASGVISNITRSHIFISFSKHLRLPGSKRSTENDDLQHEVWRIDKDELTTSYAVMRFNLVQLFLHTAQGAHLRKMIVNLEAPRFDSGSIFSQDPAISYVWSQNDLNNDQRQAILKILTAKDYALILGMPGTGKTSTMVHAVKALLIRGASILLTSYTNSAVDNLLIKLKAQSIDFIRIGRHEAVHEEVRHHCFSAMDLDSVEDIKMRFEQVKVIAVTCLGITSPLLTNKSFDVCIMDEAGQTTLPVSLGPLMFATKFVLVGDHYQLPPIVQSVEAREKGLGISLFCRLSEAHPQAISALQSQYRMCQAIMELSNALIYGNRLRCGSSEIANAKLKLSTYRSCLQWLKEVVNPSKPVLFINTDLLPAHEVKDNKTVNNPVEGYIITEVLRELLHSGVMEQDIGIITPYNSQANLIRQAVPSSSVEIHTIDKYQGRDKDCILVSFVRSTENARKCTSSLLGDWHRINVALTRAKKKLIMVGSCNTLSKVPLLKLLIMKVDEQSGILSVCWKDIEQKGLRKCITKT